MIQWMQTKPEFLERYNAFMKVLDSNPRSWFDVYPMELCSLTLKQDQPLFLDLGGGSGHQAIRLVERFPELEGRVIVQDMQSDTASLRHERVEFMRHDFFEAQPIKGTFDPLFFIVMTTTLMLYRGQDLLPPQHHPQLAKRESHPHSPASEGGHGAKLSHPHRRDDTP